MPRGQPTDEAAGLLVYMPIIVATPDVTDWERDFCASMIHQNRRGDFAPSEKQTAIMRRIVTKFQREYMAQDVVDRE